MNQTNIHLAQLRDLIARDDLPAALQQLRTLLDNSPKLDEAIHQSGRFQYIRRQIRLGVVSHAEATLTQNQIRFGLLDLLNEIEQDGATPLPIELAQNLVAAQDIQWVLGLRQDLLDQGVSVKNLPTAIMEHYGWLIEVFLQKSDDQAKEWRRTPTLATLVLHGRSLSMYHALPELHFAGANP